MRFCVSCKRRCLAAEMEQIKGKLHDANIEVVPYELPLDYSYFPADYILKVTMLSLPAKTCFACIL